MRCAAFPLYFTRFPKLRKSPADHLVWVSSRVAKGGANRRQVIRLDVYIYIYTVFFLLRPPSCFFFIIFLSFFTEQSDIRRLFSIFSPPFSLLSPFVYYLRCTLWFINTASVNWHGRSLMLCCRVQPSGWIGHCCSAQITSVAIR